MWLSFNFLLKIDINVEDTGDGADEKNDDEYTYDHEDIGDGADEENDDEYTYDHEDISEGADVENDHT